MRYLVADVRSDFTPTTYGHLTTVGPAFFLPVGKKGRKCDFQVCQCACDGSYYVKRVDDMKYGRTTSCGCARNTHGFHNDIASGYKCWESLKNRCSSPKYENYGGRGIRVCARWLEKDTGFLNFMSDMGPRPSLNHSVDRIDVNGDYCPENCRWATSSEQASNTRRNKWVEYQGERKTVEDWANSGGMDAGTLYSRIFYSRWPVAKALTEPVRSK